jgi:hypothetical protein
MGQLHHNENLAYGATPWGICFYMMSLNMKFATASIKFCKNSDLVSDGGFFDLL